MTTDLPAPARHLLDTVAAGDKPQLCLESGTRVDAGGWLRRSPVWLCITADRVVVMVAGRRCQVASVPRAACGRSRYDHATGEVVLAPAAPLPFDRLAFPPREALQILHLLDGPS